MKKMGSMYPMVPMGSVRRPTFSSSSASGFTCSAHAVPKSPSHRVIGVEEDVAQLHVGVDDSGRAAQVKVSQRGPLLDEDPPAAHWRLDRH
jgi:hypothetical protein